MLDRFLLDWSWWQSEAFLGFSHLDVWFWLLILSVSAMGVRFTAMEDGDDHGEPHEEPKPKPQPLIEPFSDGGVAAMMAWEAGDLSIAGTARLFQYLLDSGRLGQLQGMYGRTAQTLISAGLIRRKGVV